MFERLLMLAQQFSFFTKFAKSLSEVIEEINPTEEVKKFLFSLPDEQKQHYISAIKKNPNISLEELKNIKTNKSAKLPYLREEIEFANGFPTSTRQWILIQLKKLRKSVFISSEDFDDYESAEKEIPDFLKLYFIFMDEMPQLLDWIASENPELASYSAEQAIAASNKWHEEVAAKGKNSEYQEGNANIVYGPTWKNSKFNGWTIRRITTANDLDAEGFKMNHCVGSYAKEVQDENVDIYSLRDPSNNPHVTIETNHGNFTIYQIKGHSNSEPKSEYKEMIKEWFNSLKGFGKKVINTEVLSALPGRWETALKKVNEIIDGNEYGAEPNWFNFSSTIFYGDMLRFARADINKLKLVSKKTAEALFKKDKFLYNEINENVSDNRKTIAWTNNSSVKILLTMNSPAYLLSSAVNTVHIDFFLAVKNEILKLQKQDPIPKEPWMTIYTYDNLEL